MLIVHRSTQVGLNAYGPLTTSHRLPLLSTFIVGMVLLALVAFILKAIRRGWQKYIEKLRMMALKIDEL